MSNNLSSIISLCSQRKKLQLFPNPPSRIEIISPYIDSNITKFQLDMRRKAEVLKYSQGNSKMNNLTKKQILAQVMNGRSVSVSKSFITANTDISNANSIILNCDNKNLPITSSSSSSGVPNDYLNNINTLYCDPTVPLYNYINPTLTRSYGILNSPFPTSVIQYSNYTNVNTKTSSMSITTVKFTEATTNDSYTLSLLNIPLAIQIYGDISNTAYIDPATVILPNSSVNNEISFSEDVEIQDISFSLNIYFNDSLLTPNSNYIYTLDPSNNYNVTVSNTNKNVKTFSITKYIGNLSISNILLYATPEYVYDFKLKFKIGNLDEYTYLKNINVSIIANVTNAYLLNNVLSNNCDISFSNTSPYLNDLGVYTISSN